MIATLAIRSPASPRGLDRGADGRRETGHPALGDAKPGRSCPAITAARASRIGKTEDSPAPAGVIGAEMVRAGRRAAGLTRRALARRLAVPAATLRAWEQGTLPLYCVGYDQLRHLARVVGDSGERTGADLADLLLASECDLLIAGMLGGFEDYAEVPPIDHKTVGAAARELLGWALTGNVPTRFRQHAQAQPLLAQPDILRLVAIAQCLAAGTEGDDLAAFGSALVRVAARASAEY